MTLSISVFAILYLFLAMEKGEKSVLAILGAVAVIAGGAIPFEDAVRAIDLNVIFLLVGMMTCVRILAETGFFEWIAISIAKQAKGRPVLILGWMLAAVMVLSAMLDNVTTILLFVPVTILIAELLEVPVAPIIILEAMASNIGGTATLIGDPPNIIVGSRAGLTFNDFLLHLTPAAGLIAVFFIGGAILFFGRMYRTPDHIRTRVIESEPHRALRNIPVLKKSLFVLGLMFLGFLLHAVFDLPPGVVALGGMALMLLITKSSSENMLKSIEWDVVFFFIGLFIVVGALEHNGVIDALARQLEQLCGDNLLLSACVILWGSAVLSSILDNIPFVMAMTPMVQGLVHSHGGMDGDPQTQALFWALALGACLGGNGTLIGASANVVASKLGERNGHPVTFRRFLRYGIPTTLLSLVLATLYLFLRYF